MTRTMIFGLTGVLLFVACSKCELEPQKIKPVAKPIVEALGTYSRKNGIPKSFNDIKDFPYKLTPCSKKPNLDECEGLQDGYFFKHNGDYFGLKFRWTPNKEMLKGYGIFVVHNTTDCYYQIYNDKKIEKNYLIPACSLTDECRDWGRQ